MKRTGYRGRTETVRALGTYVKLMRAAGSVTARVHRPLAEVGLTIGQFAVLEALFHLGPLNQKEIAGKVLRSGGNVTMVTDNLEKRGLVRRERGTEDRRRVTVDLTRQGRALITGCFPAHAERIIEDLSILTAAEQEELGRLCRKLGLRREGGKRT